MQITVGLLGVMLEFGVGLFGYVCQVIVCITVLGDFGYVAIGCAVA